MSIQHSYAFISDLGHAWLEVPMSMLQYLGIKNKISNYSYLKNGVAYLEEDCDAPIFLDAYRNRYGFRPRFVEEHQEVTPIRDYPRYSY